MQRDCITLNISKTKLKEILNLAIIIIPAIAGTAWILFGELFIGFAQGDLISNITALFFEAVIPFSILTLVNLLLKKLNAGSFLVTVATIAGSLAIGAKYCFHHLGGIDRTENLIALVSVIIGGCLIYTVILAVVCLIIGKVIMRKWYNTFY